MKKIWHMYLVIVYNHVYFDADQDQDVVFKTLNVFLNCTSFMQVSYLVFSLSGRHTLWRCLQSTVTPILASMLEVMDRYANLDQLSDDRLSEGRVKLWLDILADSQILDLAPHQNTR